VIHHGGFLHTPAFIEARTIFNVGNRTVIPALFRALLRQDGGKGAGGGQDGHGCWNTARHGWSQCDTISLDRNACTYQILNPEAGELS